MRFRSILLLGVSSVALQHADAQTAGVNGVPGSTVVVPRVFLNRPIYIVPGSPTGNTAPTTTTPTVATPTVATPIYVPPSPFGPLGQLPLMTGGLPGFNAPLNQMPIPIAPASPTTTPVFGSTGFAGGFGLNAPIVGQSPTGFAAQPSGLKQNP